MNIDNLQQFGKIKVSINNSIINLNKQEALFLSGFPFRLPRRKELFVLKFMALTNAECVKRYRQTHLEQIKQYQQKYRDENRETINTHALEYYRNNIVKRHAYKKQYSKMLFLNRKTDIKYLVMTLYIGMRSRIKGKSGGKYYIGLPICAREEFYNLALNSEQLKTVFIQWQESGYKSDFAPTVDRIINERGYALNNIQFLSKSDNSKKSHIQRRKKQGGKNENQIFKSQQDRHLPLLKKQALVSKP
jgi:hypothetical protein